eukprot:6203759-Pleurochrysis_carterae.AAC.1
MRYQRKQRLATVKSARAIMMCTSRRPLRSTCPCLLSRIRPEPNSIRGQMQRMRGNVRRCSVLNQIELASGEIDRAVHRSSQLL